MFSFLSGVRVIF